MVGRGGNVTIRISDGMLLGGGISTEKRAGNLIFLVKLNTSSCNKFFWKNLNVNNKESSVGYVC